MKSTFSVPMPRVEFEIMPLAVFLTPRDGNRYAIRHSPGSRFPDVPQFAVTYWISPTDFDPTPMPRNWRTSGYRRGVVYIAAVFHSRTMAKAYLRERRLKLGTSVLCLPPAIASGKPVPE